MTNSIATTLTTYGFEDRDTELFWGYGSWINGHYASVKKLNSDLYEVTIAHWACNEWMEPVRDTRETRVLHGALALAWIFEEVPSCFWRRR